MHRMHICLLIAVLFVIIIVSGSEAMSESPFPRRLKMPPLPTDLTWMNTAESIDLDDLRGKFVLLDFWTYCCINCMHVLPELEKLEKAYPNELVVIGVHSAKFDTEKETKNITEAILRYRIKHPVINDANQVIWDRLGIRSWPTLLLIDPEGYVVWGQSGETTFDELDPILRRALPYYRKKSLLDETPLRFELESDSQIETPLRFPGKVLADATSDRLFIADSGHQRIVITRLDGTLLEVIGSGSIGRKDGDFAHAQFNDPQGMALRGKMLYVADTHNHLIRRIDLNERKVITLAGLGHQDRKPPVFRMSDPIKRALSSPWALWIHEPDLFIAMAGPHQIWKMKLDGSSIGPYAGNGREDIVDGPLTPKEPYLPGHASFAQPSGLASDGTWLYVADSEGSSIRAVPLNPRQDVRTVVGTAHLSGGRLFTFGDVEGPPDIARLQHPLGIVFHKGMLYVADTYNNKIKTVDPATGETKTLLGTDDSTQFDEPAGITAAGGKLYVADTNNHRIRSIELSDGPTVQTLEIPNLEPPIRSKISTKRSFSRATQIAIEPTTVRPKDGSIRLHLVVKLPDGFQINPTAPGAYWLESIESDSPIRRDVLDRWIRPKPPSAEIDIRLPIATSGTTTLRVGLVYYYCREGTAAVCKIGSVVWTVPLEISTDAATSLIRLEHEVRS